MSYLFTHTMRVAMPGLLHGCAVVVGVGGHVGAVCLDHSGLGGILWRAPQLLPVTETLAIVLSEDKQHQRVDAAVGVTQTDTDVVDIDKGVGWPVVAQVNHLDHVIRTPAHQEESNDHHHGLGGALRPDRLFTLDSADGSEDVVKGEGVEGRDDDEREDEAQDGLVESVPVHVLRPIQEHHAYLQVALPHHHGIDHDGHGEQEAADPHQDVDDDGPLDGPLV